MPNDIEWIVPKTPVRDADRRASPVGKGLELPAWQRATRVVELRRQVRDGYYVSEAMMDALARRLLASGEL